MSRFVVLIVGLAGSGLVLVGMLVTAVALYGGTVASPGASPSAEGSAPPSEPAATSTPEALVVHAAEFNFDPQHLSVAAAGSYTVTLVNDGSVLHDLTLSDGTVISAEAGTSASGTVQVPADGLTFICSVSGHATAGMTGAITVGADGSPAASHEMTAEEMRDADAAVTGQFPAATAGKGNVILEPTILDDGTLSWDLTASVFDWEVSPGVIVEAWGYNQMVPGPQLRAEIGDRVRITLHNELAAPTTIHFHGLIVPNDMDGVPVISQPATMPGESFVYEFTLRNAGSHMYHSHFMANEQVPRGLLGAFVVSDPGNPNEPSADMDATLILNDGPLGYTLNGKGFPATEPFVLQLGQVLRLRYMNEGLQIHPMHLHGIVQLVVAKDGYLLLTPHFEDTVLVAPGERVDVLVTATEPGIWALHCHILNHAESEDGMFGMVTAVIVQGP